MLRQSLAQPRERRLAFQQRAVRCAVRVHKRKQGVAQRQCIGPGIEKLGEAVGIIGPHRGATEDQRALAAQRLVGAGLAKASCNEPSDLVVTFAERQCPGGCQYWWDSEGTTDVLPREAAIHALFGGGLLRQNHRSTKLRSSSSV